MTITAIVTSGIGRQIEEKVLPNDFFEVNTRWPGSRSTSEDQSGKSAS